MRIIKASETEFKKEISPECDSGENEDKNKEELNKAEANDITELKKEIERKLEMKYAYAASENIPSKLTATEMKGRFKDEEALEDAEKMAFIKRSREHVRPDFYAAKKALTAAEKLNCLLNIINNAFRRSCANLSAEGSHKSAVVAVMGTAS